MKFNYKILFNNLIQEDQNDEEKKEEKQHFHFGNVILIIFLFFSFLINIMIILIHSKQKFFRKGFFIIVFVQIILEAIINLSILIMNIIYIFDIDRGKWFFIFPILFNFGYITNILYNIRILIYLMTINKKKDELVNYDTKDESFESDKNSQLSRNSSISFISHSFKSFHILCFLLSTIHTIIYILYLKDDIEKDKDDNNSKKDWKWFHYFMNGDQGYYRFAFYLFHYIYFIISIPYLIKSLNKGKISDHIFLKRFSIYCIISSFISLLFPLAVIFDLTLGEKHKDIYLYLLIAFIFYLLITWFFRLNCYYIQYILEQGGKGFCKKISTGFKILFCCLKIPSPNFIDLNSSFIYHSLANVNDFLQEKHVDDNDANSEEEQ